MTRKECSLTVSVRISRRYRQYDVEQCHCSVEHPHDAFNADSVFKAEWMRTRY